MIGHLAATLQPGGYVLGIGGSQTGTMPAAFETPGGVVTAQPGIGPAPAVIAPSVTGYGSTQTQSAAGGLSTFQEILIGLAIVAAIVIIPTLNKR